MKGGCRLAPPLNDIGKIRGAAGLKQPEPLVSVASELIMVFMCLSGSKKLREE